MGSARQWRASILQPPLENVLVLLLLVHGGQWKLDRAGDYCLSQQGAAAGVEDAAERGAITASSTADAAAHGANMAVDESSSTFWVMFLFFIVGVCASRVVCTVHVRRPVAWTPQGL